MDNYYQNPITHKINRSETAGAGFELSSSVKHDSLEFSETKRYNKRISEIEQNGRIIDNFVNPVVNKRRQINGTSDEHIEPNFLPTNSANVLRFVSSIKYNSAVINLLNIADIYGLSYSKSIDESARKTVGEMGQEFERSLLKWMINQRPNNKLFSELNSLLGCSSYEEMTNKIRLINLSHFPSEIPNIFGIKSSHIKIEEIKKYAIFAKKLHLHRKGWGKRIADFKERIVEMGKAEAVLGRLESAVSKIRSEQDMVVANGKKILPLEKNAKNIIKLISTIQYNDAAWTIQSLGVDSGMRYADGVNRKDAEMNISKNDYVSSMTFSWIAENYNNTRLINEMGRLLKLVENISTLRSIDDDWLAIESEFDIDLSAFPNTLPNILVMRPVRFTVRK